MISGQLEMLSFVSMIGNHCDCSCIVKLADCESVRGRGADRKIPNSMVEQASPDLPGTAWAVLRLPSNPMDVSATRGTATLRGDDCDRESVC